VLWSAARIAAFPFSLFQSVRGKKENAKAAMLAALQSTAALAAPLAAQSSAGVDCNSTAWGYNTGLVSEDMLELAPWRTGLLHACSRVPALSPPAPGVCRRGQQARALPGCKQPFRAPDSPAPAAAAPEEPSFLTTAAAQPASSGNSPSPAVPSPANGAGEDVTEWATFLRPAQGPGELGRLGGYRILKVLGKGGMGVVFEAEDVQLGRRVALKAMLPSVAASPQARQRFLREARLAAAIEHDHVVSIHQVGQDGAVPFLAMPLLRGESLEARLKRGRLPLVEAVRIGREMAEGLAAAHEAGLVHRDVKPGNVWLEARGHKRPACEPEEPTSEPLVATWCRVKLLDFGLARSADDEAHLTATGVVLGTPAYMAPEQAEGKAVVHRCDLFSLGCVLYRMAAGAAPFQGGTVLEVMRALAAHEPPPLRQLCPEAPAALEQLVARLLAKDREQRPASAREVADALAAIERSGAVTTAGPPTAPPDSGSGADAWPQTEVTPAAPAPTQPPSAVAPRRRRWPVAAGLLVLLGAGLVAGFLLLPRGHEDSPPGQAPVTDKDQPDAKVANVPLDSLDPGQIPVEERFDWQPKELVAVIGKHAGRAWASLSNAAYSPDEKTIAVIRHSVSDPVIRLFDADRLVQKAAIRHNWPLHMAAGLEFSPDGKTLLASDWSGSLLYDLAATPPKLKATLPGNAISLSGRRLTRDSRSLIAVEKATVSLWNVAVDPPAKAKEFTLPAGAECFSAAFVGEGAHAAVLATIGNGFELQLWDITANPAKRTDRIALATGPSHVRVTAGAISPDGRRVALFVPEPKRLAIFEVRDGKLVEIDAIRDPGQWFLPQHPFSSDGKLFVYPSSGWEEAALRNVDERTTRPLPATIAYPLVGLSPSGRRLAGAGWNSVGGLRLGYLRQLRVWDVGAAEVKEVTEEDSTGPPVLSADRRRVLVPHRDGLRLWALDGAAPRPGPLLPHTVSAYWGLSELLGAMGVLPDGRIVAPLQSLGGALALVDPAAGLDAPPVKLPPDRAFLAASPTGATVALWGREDGKAKVSLCDLGGDTPRLRGPGYAGPDTLLTADISPDGRQLATRGHDDGDRLLDCTGATPRELSGPVQNGLGSIPTFAADGTTVSTGGGVIFHHRWTGKKLEKLAELNPGFYPHSVALLGDGRTVIGCDRLGMVSYLDLKTSRVLRREQWEGATRFLPAWDGRHLFALNGNGTVYVLRYKNADGSPYVPPARGR
jgi:serine/threonine protein kinase/WD40 repeat protein